MPQWQPSQNRNFELRSQPVNHRLEFETLVVGNQLIGCELSKHDGLLILQNTRIEQLRQHAFNLIGVLSYVF